MTYSITRDIRIDMGHRIPSHGSKCKYLHGHSMLIEATCESSALIDTGVQEGMVLDYSFLKEEMMELIDAPCDHGLVLCAHDPLIAWLPVDTQRAIGHDIETHGWSLGIVPIIGKLYVIPVVPTSENLAAHWFNLLMARVEVRSNHLARLTSVLVHETPNCRALYQP